MLSGGLGIFSCGVSIGEIMLTKNDLNKLALDKAYKVIMKSASYAPNLTLVGAYSLFREFKRVNIDYETVGRMTIDLDFESFHTRVSEQDYLEFQQALTSSLDTDFKIRFMPLKERRNSVTYTFKVEYLGVTSSKLKIAFTTVNGIKRFDCQPLYISFAKKLALSNQLVDRRPKDKIDWYIVYCYLYPKGISKDDILTLLRTTGNSFKVNPMWLTQEGLSLALKSTKGFRGVDQANLEHVIFVTQSLLRGLDSRYVPKHAVFKGGEWVW